MSDINAVKFVSVENTTVRDDVCNGPCDGESTVLPAFAAGKQIEAAASSGKNSPTPPLNHGSSAVDDTPLEYRAAAAVTQQETPHPTTTNATVPTPNESTPVKNAESSGAVTPVSPSGNESPVPSCVSPEHCASAEPQKSTGGNVVPGSAGNGDEVAIGVEVNVPERNCDDEFESLSSLIKNAWDTYSDICDSFHGHGSFETLEKVACEVAALKENVLHEYDLLPDDEKYLTEAIRSQLNAVLLETRDIRLLNKLADLKILMSEASIPCLAAYNAAILALCDAKAKLVLEQGYFRKLSEIHTSTAVYDEALLIVKKHKYAKERIPDVDQNDQLSQM